MNSAWVTLLTQPEYLPGVNALARSLVRQGSQAPLVVMTLPTIITQARTVLADCGCEFIEIEPVGPNPALATHYANPRFAEVWAKLAVWTLTDFDQVVFLDADMLVIQNMDELLTMALPDNGYGIAACHACRCNPRQIASYPENWHPAICYYSYCLTPEMVAQPRPTHDKYFNAGLLVLRPDKGVWQQMMDALAAVTDLTDYIFAEQDFLNDFYRGRWQPLHYGYNAVKTLAAQHPHMWQLSRIKNLHFILDKPWQRVPEPGDPWYDLHQLWWQHSME